MKKMMVFSRALCTALPTSFAGRLRVSAEAPDESKSSRQVDLASVTLYLGEAWPVSCLPRKRMPSQDPTACPRMRHARFACALSASSLTDGLLPYEYI